MKDLEHKLQVNCVRWFRYQYADKIIFAIPNGSFRNVITAKNLKDEGVLSGVPDLCVPCAMGGYHGLYIEMKNGNAGRLSENQQNVIDKLRKEGYKVNVARKFEDFVGIVREYFAEEQATRDERIAASVQDDVILDNIRRKQGRGAVMPIAEEMIDRHFHRCAKPRKIKDFIETSDNNKEKNYKKEIKVVHNETQRPILPDCGCN